MKIGPIFEAEDNLRLQIITQLDSIIQKYESMGMACWIYLKGNEAIEVASIKVKDKTKRKQGLGTGLMQEITGLCDKYNLLCVLTPEATETPMSVLLRFYKGFGFVPNKGRNKDFKYRAGMIRYPK
jgi:GNAT superfamily N-acetyltransferase